MLLTHLKFKVLFHSEFVREKPWVCLCCVSIFSEFQRRREACKDWGSSGEGLLKIQEVLKGGSLMFRKGQLTQVSRSPWYIVDLQGLFLLKTIWAVKHSAEERRLSNLPCCLQVMQRIPRFQLSPVINHTEIGFRGCIYFWVTHTPYK